MPDRSNPRTCSVTDAWGCRPFTQSTYVPLARLLLFLSYSLLFAAGAPVRPGTRRNRFLRAMGTEL
jgi:hypothetical protein